MRISSLQVFNIADKGMADASQALTHTQEQISTGKRVLTPSDDPIASTKIMQLNKELANIDQYGKNINIAQNNLVIEETSLSSVSNLLQRIQELAIQAGNTATLSTHEYAALASEVDVRLDELVNILNSQNANGDYIFGGYKSLSEPFSGSPQEGYSYHGDEGQQYIKIANNTTIESSDSGKRMFVDIESEENTIVTSASSANRSVPPVSISIGAVVDQQAFDDFYPEDMIITFNQDSNVAPPGKNFTVTERSTGRIVVADQEFSSGKSIELNGVEFTINGNPVSGGAGVTGDRLFVSSTKKQDVLTTLSRFSNAMKQYDGSEEGRESLDDVIASTLGNLKNSQTSILDVTAQLGARFNILESTRDLHLDSALVMKDVMSQLRDVDYAEAATRLSMESMVLQAAQSAFVRVSQLTLFSRL